MRGRRVRWLAAGVFSLAMAVPMGVAATSYDPLPRQDEPAGMELTAGMTVFLFHSGTEQVRQSLHVGDVLEISRVGPDGASLSVGKIRVAAFLGAVCLRGEVLEGRIRPHDLAEKDGVYYLVIPEAVCTR
jgi:hypothetical protein